MQNRSTSASRRKVKTLYSSSRHQTHEMPGCCYSYYSVNHYRFSSVPCSVHTRINNLGHSLLYLNVVVTPETSPCVCVQTESNTFKTAGLHKQWVTYHAGPLGNPSGTSPSSWPRSCCCIPPRQQSRSTLKPKRNHNHFKYYNKALQACNSYW